MHLLLSTVCILLVHEVNFDIDFINCFNHVLSIFMLVYMCVFTELPTKKQQLQALNLLVLLLPEANRNTLKVDAHPLKVLLYMWDFH